MLIPPSPLRLPWKQKMTNIGHGNTFLQKQYKLLYPTYCYVQSEVTIESIKVSSREVGDSYLLRTNRIRGFVCA